MNNFYHVIKDPVHGTMQFTSIEDKWVKPFIDSPHFQRLRHIKQLGMGDYIFPGAMHSRFNHCIGCCYTASQIAYKIGLADEERQLVMIACLLHDIGHGPFSHTFEDIFHQKLIRHEDWTPYFLKAYGSADFFKLYNQLNPRYHLTQEKFQQIENMIMHKTTSKSVLADIVSSQLDADRLDYLLRDSHFCGVQYGHFDFRWMLHCMTIVNDNSRERLGITHKGIGVVEHYLMARRLMMRNIYHAQKKLAIEFLLVKLLSMLAENIEKHAKYQLIANTTLGKFLTAANQFNLSVQQQENFDELKQSFLAENFHTYQSLCDYDIFSLIQQLATDGDDDSVNQLAKRLHHRQMPKIFRFDYHHLDRVKLLLDEFKMKHKHAYEDWQLAIITTPHQSYSGEEDPILVCNEHEIIKPIDKYSIMLEAIADKCEHLAFLSVDKFIAEDDHVITLIKELE